MLKSGWTRERFMAQIRARNNGSASVSENGSSCAYRGADGNACAIGCFIPDDVYSKSYEGKGVLKLLQRHPEIWEFMPSDDINFLSRLQTVHDRYSNNTYEHIEEFLDREGVK